MQVQKRILVCPLDWGLGHATRCIPIIKQLLAAGAEVIVAADKRPLALLQQEFPLLTFIVLPGYAISYPSKGSMALKMLLSLPKLIKGIYKEHKALQRIVRQYKINAVISDNRFGLWSREVHCVFITHQLNIRAPFGEVLLYWLTNKIIEKYNLCWIPDDASSTLTGALTTTYKLPANSIFIGALSRFNKSQFRSCTEPSFLLVLISGPEPQRSIFEQLVLAQLAPLKIETLVVQGLPDESNVGFKSYNEYIQLIAHLPTAKMEAAINSASLVISRSGYSTIMDLAVLGKKALFVPTPGQTEQEYLGRYFMQQKIALVQEQHKIDFSDILSKIKCYVGFANCDNSLYKPVIDRWIKAI